MRVRPCHYWQWVLNGVCCLCAYLITAQVLISAFSSYLFQQLASHGLFDVHVKATGDIHIDDHHTNEDVALAIGTVSFQE